jgi:glycosyltransferase involved in cell wall biosynthesis
MRILEVLTYYRPWVSGLTIYVEWLSRALVRQGHDVTVLTSQYDSDLPRYDVVQGVKIVRVPVALRVSKGVIMPGFGPMAWKLARQHDLLHIHLPQFDAPGVAMRGRVLGKPVVLTYHCDLKMPAGKLNSAANQVVALMNRLAGELAHAIVTYTHDYAHHSPYLARYVGRKIVVIPPPVEKLTCDAAVAQAFRHRHQLEGRKVIGISARLAAEKGVEILLKALPRVLERHPDVTVLHAGMVEGVIGEHEYAARVAPLIERHSRNYILLGNLEGEEYAAFHNSLDCLVICSLNSTESFGLVQIEAMACGTPVIASSLPGVRQPVTMTGMGEIAPVGDHVALADAITRVLDNKQAYVMPPAIISSSFSPDATASAYTRLFQRLLQGRFTPSTDEPGAYDRLRAVRDELANTGGGTADD